MFKFFKGLGIILLCNLAISGVAIGEVWLLGFLMDNYFSTSEQILEYHIPFFYIYILLYIVMFIYVSRKLEIFKNLQIFRLIFKIRIKKVIPYGLVGCLYGLIANLFNCISFFLVPLAYIFTWFGKMYGGDWLKHIGISISVVTFLMFVFTGIKGGIASHAPK